MRQAPITKWQRTYRFIQKIGPIWWVVVAFCAMLGGVFGTGRVYAQLGATDRALETRIGAAENKLREVHDGLNTTQADVTCLREKLGALPQLRDDLAATRADIRELLRIERSRR